MPINEHQKPWTRDVTEDWERIFGKKEKEQDNEKDEHNSNSKEKK